MTPLVQIQHMMQVKSKNETLLEENASLQAHIAKLQADNSRLQADGKQVQQSSRRNSLNVDAEVQVSRDALILLCFVCFRQAARPHVATVSCDPCVHV